MSNEPQSVGKWFVWASTLMLLGIGLATLATQSDLGSLDRSTGVAAIVLLVGAGLLAVAGTRDWWIRRRRPPEPPEAAPPAPPLMLFTITLPEPTPGRIDRYETVLFENTYVATEAERALRFNLNMEGHRFLDHLEFHAIWRRRAATSTEFRQDYLPNPLQARPSHREGHLAFIHATGSDPGSAPEWAMTIETGDGPGRHVFTISSAGSWTCWDDGNVARA